MRYQGLDEVRPSSAKFGRAVRFPSQCHLLSDLEKGRDNSLDFILNYDVRSEIRLNLVIEIVICFCAVIVLATCNKSPDLGFALGFLLGAMSVKPCKTSFELWLEYYQETLSHQDRTLIYLLAVFGTIIYLLMMSGGIALIFTYIEIIIHIIRR
ncbi:hypothetical protein CAAN1_03S02190 [[Candida] anglica]